MPANKGNYMLSNSAMLCQQYLTIVDTTSSDLTKLTKLMFYAVYPVTKMINNSGTYY
ncbi:MAG: hypothetical protein ACI89T_001841 [Cognaticolwellia sp.]|jgi:hypothetical protein